MLIAPLNLRRPRRKPRKCHFFYPNHFFEFLEFTFPEKCKVINRSKKYLSKVKQWPFQVCYLTCLKLHLEISDADYSKLARPSLGQFSREPAHVYFLALLCVGIHTAGRFSDVTDTFTIIMTDCEWVSSHKYASGLCSSIG